MTHPTTVSANTERGNMTDDQIKHMVDRFLAWKLPVDFNPDGGISFDPDHSGGWTPYRHEPVGTNLLTAEQAREMVRHMIEGLPDTATVALEEAAKVVERVENWHGQDYYCENCKGGTIYPDREEVAAQIRALAVSSRRP